MDCRESIAFGLQIRLKKPELILRLRYLDVWKVLKNKLNAF